MGSLSFLQSQPILDYIVSCSSNMEVETHALASPFHYKMDISTDFLVTDSPDLPLAVDSLKIDGHQSMESGDRECKEFEMPVLTDEGGVLKDPTGNLPVAKVSEGPCTDSAAVKLQKVYRSYRTRRRLADSAVVVEELWYVTKCPLFIYFLSD